MTVSLSSQNYSYTLDETENTVTIKDKNDGRLVEVVQCDDLDDALALLKNTHDDLNQTNEQIREYLGLLDIKL